MLGAGHYPRTGVGGWVGVCVCVGGLPLSDFIRLAGMQRFHSQVAVALGYV